ncbi:hypothetical protein ACFQ0G_38555 [Streptomyces chiangmaiensis]
MGESHPLLTFFMAAADGCFPPADGRVTVLPPLAGGLECSVAFTGHAVVATALTSQAVHAQGPDGFGASLSPDFLRHLAGPKGWIDVTDATLTARGTAARRAWQSWPMRMTIHASAMPGRCGQTSRSTVTNAASSPWPTASPGGGS